MSLTLLAVPRFEGAVTFLVGAAFLPARTFFEALAAASLAAADLGTLVASNFFSATLLGAEALAVVTVFAFGTTFLAEVDLTAVAFAEAIFAGRPFVTGLGTTFAGLF